MSLQPWVQKEGGRRGPGWDQDEKGSASGLDLLCWELAKGLQQRTALIIFVFLKGYSDGSGDELC